MANPEHLIILKRGIEDWNRWRKERSEIRPDISQVNFNGVDLSRANFAGAFISDADLAGANISEADLRGAELIATNLFGANLHRADLSDADLLDADLGAADLSHASLSHANLRRTNFRNANLRGASLDADLYEPVLSGADLRDADFRDARIRRAELSGANLSEATLDETVFADCNLSEVNGLEQVQHVGPSTIGIDTVYKSAGKIPDAFLRGAGVPESFISFVHSLSVRPVQYATCLVVFAVADAVFSQRLYKDLFSAGVRCWTRQIKDPTGVITSHFSMSDFDQLVVVCSEHSLGSVRLDGDIVSALLKEDALQKRNQRRQVLFPIRLDDYIFKTWKHHRKADVLKNNVGDFRNWQDPAQYRNALDRLIRDLNA